MIFTAMGSTPPYEKGKKTHTHTRVSMSTAISACVCAYVCAGGNTNLTLWEVAR